MLTLANTYTASSTLANAAQPILERMSATYGESFSVATLDGDQIVYIAVSYTHLACAGLCPTGSW